MSTTSLLLKLIMLTTTTSTQLQPLITQLDMTLWKIFAVDTQFKQLRKRSLKKIQASAEAWIFFRLLFRNCLNCVSTAKIFHNVITHNRGTNPVTSIGYIVKSHFKALSLYNFKRGFWWTYKRGGLYPGRLISGIKINVWERRDKTYLRNELKLTFHSILSYIYDTLIVRHKTTFLCL